MTVHRYANGLFIPPGSHPQIESRRRGYVPRRVLAWRLLRLLVVR